MLAKGVTDPHEEKHAGEDARLKELESQVVDTFILLTSSLVDCLRAVQACKGDLDSKSLETLLLYKSPFV